MKLNGWKRIWVVFVVIYFAPVSWYCYSNIPDYNVENQWVSEATRLVFGPSGSSVLFGRNSKNEFKSTTEIIAELKAMAAVSDKPNTIALVGDQYQEIALLNAKYEQYKNDELVSQIKFILLCILFWLLTSLTLLGAGYAVNWIIAGFRQKG